ncbi:phosphate ABC transporter substrate-binding protein [Sulfurospirillum barnesii]|uniref:Phosphate ABC transporter substrate-binding protein, PhoT family n=1 Tax=Sulfurospirillum barnesii (strain ATCC 700032 / DSM 10660 / SES-3) TaxID=760154 RepID=I3Y0G4_SULBS|nr:phosphate ABC transporter substrate-binding protein [Sulfurospirillum barnesii]AFL69688.1 phosphate ABC transporter substrate-binding protein, PhoT family [Sulfurospirillum barnesii SES-3]
MRMLLTWMLSFVFIYATDLSYAGSSTIGKTVFPVLAKEFSQKAGHTFSRIENPGSGQGVDALLKDKVDLAGISRGIEDKERAQNLRFFIIGYDAIGVVVHKDNPVKNLSMEQLKAIFGGKITNWSEVGGNNAKIDVVVEILGDKRATQIVFTEIVFDTKTLIGTYSKDAIEVDAPLDEVAYVKNHPHAITAVSMVFSKTNPEVKSLAINGIEAIEKNIADGSYPISRPLILVTKENISAPLLQFLEYVYSKEAQAIINKTFVSAR